MKKYLLMYLILFVTLLNSLPIPQFDALIKDLSLQTEQWQGTNEKNRDTREYEVGDTNIFWSWDFTGMPPSWIQLAATCRAVGEHSYLFVADNQWNLNMDQSDVDTIMPYLEDQTMNSTEYGAIEMDINLFGPIPDEIDNDPKIIVFYSELGSYMGSMFDGYFSPYNQVTEAQAQQMNPPGHSNECEMIYMTCHPLNPTEPIRISVLAHELQHMIHWGMDINEDTWVDEGCAELAMVYFGLPDPISGFPNNPDNSLTVWDQQFADYVKVMLFFTYLEEQYDVSADSLIKDIVAEPANSITGISNQLVANNIDKTFEEIFVDWTIANFIDDPSVANGLYNYEALNLPGFHVIQNHNSFPAGFTSTASAWATDYIKIYPPESGLELEIDVNHDQQSISFIKKYLDGSGYDVDIEIIDGSWNGIFPWSWYEDYEYVVAVYASHHNTALDYDYTLTELLSTDENISIGSNSISNYPNPFNPSTTISYETMNLHEETRIEIFNLKGQKVKTFSNLQISNFPIQHVVWNGTDESEKPVTSGIYLYKLISGEKILTKKMLMIK